MAKLLITKERSWYDELKEISSYYEAELESLIRQHVSHTFPDFFTVKYTRVINAENYKPKKPDLAMIRKDYKEWWIVEVEREYHTLDHILDQVTVFTNGDYNPVAVADYIYKKAKEACITQIVKKKTDTCF